MNDLRTTKRVQNRNGSGEAVPFRALPADEMRAGLKGYLASKGENVNPFRPARRPFWGTNTTARLQLLRVADMTERECLYALHDPQTQPATRGALQRRIRILESRRLGLANN